MLSMINPDSLTRLDNKFTTIHGASPNMNGKSSHENFYHEELEDHVPQGSLP